MFVFDAHSPCRFYVGDRIRIGYSENYLQSIPPADFSYLPVNSGTIVLSERRTLISQAMPSGE